MENNNNMKANNSNSNNDKSSNNMEANENNSNMKNNSKNSNNDSSTTISNKENTGSINHNKEHHSGSKTATAADNVAMMRSAPGDTHCRDDINLSAPVQVKHAGAPKDANKLYKVAARNLRHDYGVQSMTPANLKKTMALLELRPRRLVVHGLASQQLLRGRSRQDTLESEGDDTNAMASAWECLDINNGDSSDSHDGDGREIQEDMTDGGSDDGQQPPGGDSNSDSDYHDNKAQHRRGDNKARRPIHTALITGGIDIRPCETGLLLHALGVGPGRLVRLGLVDHEALGAMHGERDRRRHGVQKGRRRSGHSLAHPAFPPPRPHGHGHGGGHQRGGSGDEGRYGRHGPCHRRLEHGSPSHGHHGGLRQGAACFSCWQPHGPHGPGRYGKAHGEMHGRRHGGPRRGGHNMHGGSGDEHRHPPHGRVQRRGGPEHGGRPCGHPCPSWRRGGSPPSPPRHGPGHRGGPMCDTSDDDHMHRPLRHGGRFRGHEGGPRRGGIMHIRLSDEDSPGLARHGHRRGDHGHPMEREGGEHEHVRRGAHGRHGPPHCGHLHAHRAASGGGGRGARRMGGHVVAY